MLSKWQFSLLTLLGAAALLLVTANVVLSTLNRNAQIALNQRQVFIQQTVPLEGLYRDILKALAEMAVKSNDKQVFDMLSAQGLSVTMNSPVAASSEPPAQKNEKQK